MLGYDVDDERNARTEGSVRAAVGVRGVRSAGHYCVGERTVLGPDGVTSAVFGVFNLATIARTYVQLSDDTPSPTA